MKWHSMPAPKRKVTPRHRAQAIGIMALAFGGLCVAIFLSSLCGLLMFLEYDLTTRGIAAEATVTDSTVITTKGGDILKLFYAFTVNDQIYYNQQHQLSGSSANITAYPAGSLLKIRYMPDNPLHHRVDDPNPDYVRNQLVIYALLAHGTLVISMLVYKAARYAWKLQHA